MRQVGRRADGGAGVRRALPAVAASSGLDDRVAAPTPVGRAVYGQGGPGRPAAVVEAPAQDSARGRLDFGDLAHADDAHWAGVVPDLPLVESGGAVVKT